MVESINSWSKRAKCRNMLNDDIFFPTDARGVAQGRRFCSNCPVKDNCESYALVHSLPGIWGGTSESQREKTSPILKDVLRSLYQREGLLESAWLRPEDLEQLVGQPSEPSGPSEDVMVG
jgi:hypothetical protein